MNPLVTTEWLAKELGAPDLRVVDGSWHMPQLNRDARVHRAGPGSRFTGLTPLSSRAFSQDR